MSTGVFYAISYNSSTAEESVTVAATYISAAASVARDRDRVSADILIESFLINNCVVVIVLEINFNL